MVTEAIVIVIAADSDRIDWPQPKCGSIRTCYVQGAFCGPGVSLCGPGVSLCGPGVSLRCSGVHHVYYYKLRPPRHTVVVLVCDWITPLTILLTASLFHCHHGSL